jgi:hypothetical protein
MQREENMRKPIGIGMVLIFGAGVATAQVQPLSDEQLDFITAGSAAGMDGAPNHAAGGFVVANASTAAVDEQNAMRLESEAQGNAEAVNVVNAADSLVAQGLNVWGGDFQSADALDAAVEQSNLVVQTEATRSATLAAYQRDANQFDGSTLDTTTSNLDTIDLVSDVMVDTNHQILGQSVNVGLGVGVAGRVGIDLDAASIGFDLVAESELATNVDVNGTINLPRPFGAMQANGNLDSTITNSGSASLNVDTPPVTIDAIGSVCYTKLGLCEATADDNSTYQTNTTHAETMNHEVQGAVAMEGANAEYVVIDDSNLELIRGQTLTLASGAQSGLSALNVVNAVGSMVANGVNVSRTNAEAGSSLPASLNQRNVVLQSF